MQPLPRLEKAGIDAWLIRLAESIDERHLPLLQTLAKNCEAALGDLLLDLVPSYTSLLVHYNCLEIDSEQVRQRLQRVLAQLASPDNQPLGRLHELPIWYDPSVGPDLPALEEHTGLSWQQLVELHAGSSYRVFALGFAPGFAFMGCLPPELQVPRHSTPRKRVAALSLAIAEQQTAIYPQASPGGWHLLGRGCTRLFNPERNPPSLLQVGDQVQFQPLTKAEFLRLGGEVSNL